MTRAALDIVLNDPERYVLTDEERQQYERLAVLYGHAAVDASRFPLSPKQAARLKSVVKKARGPAQPQSRRNKRKARQERRIAFAKQRRKNNREFREQYNEAMRQMEAEREEAEKAYAEIAARIENERKYQIKDGMGNLIMSEIPASAISPMDAPEQSFADPAEAPLRILLPGDLPQE